MLLCCTHIHVYFRPFSLAKQKTEKKRYQTLIESKGSPSPSGRYRSTKRQLLQSFMEPRLFFRAKTKVSFLAFHFWQFKAKKFHLVLLVPCPQKHRRVLEMTCVFKCVRLLALLQATTNRTHAIQTLRESEKFPNKP